MEIRHSYDLFISTMGFPLLVRFHLYIQSAPWSLQRWVNKIILSNHSMIWYQLFTNMSSCQDDVLITKVWLSLMYFMPGRDVERCVDTSNLQQSFPYCSGSLEPEYSCHDRDWIMELPMEADILTFTGILTPEDASVASCSPLISRSA